MNSTDRWRRYLEAGMTISKLTRERAEAVMRALLEEGGAPSDHAQRWVEDLLERSRRRAQDLVALVGDEVSKQLQTWGLGSAEDLLREVLRRIREAPTPDRGAEQRTTEPIPAARGSATKASGSRKAAGRPRGPAVGKPSAKKVPRTTAKKAGAPKKPATRKAAATAVPKKAAKLAAPAPPRSVRPSQQPAP